MKSPVALSALIFILATLIGTGQGVNFKREQSYQVPGSASSNYLTQDELARLQDIYGPEYVQHHYATFLKIKQLRDSGVQIEEQVTQVRLFDQFPF